MYRKIFRILLTLQIISYSSIVYALKESSVLLKADSLFEQKQYTESLELYENCFQNGYYSPRMLIRLSLIKEGLGDYTYALYYLNIYYSKIPDQAVLKKMDELAERYNLEGYDYNDLVFFISLYHQYYEYIILAFLVLSAFFLIYLFIKKREKAKLGLRPLFFMIILGLAYLISNYNIIPEKAIVNTDATLMAAPAAGAPKMGTINKGHRVTIRGREDIWCKISWQDKIVYIRESNLLITSLKQNLQ